MPWGRSAGSIRTGADALIEAAADERTGEALDRAAGSDWRWTARAGSLVAAAARVVTGDPSKPTTDAEAGEPLAVEDADGAPSRDTER